MLVLRIVRTLLVQQPPLPASLLLLPLAVDLHRRQLINASSAGSVILSPDVGSSKKISSLALCAHQVARTLLLLTLLSPSTNKRTLNFAFPHQHALALSELSRRRRRRRLFSLRILTYFSCSLSLSTQHFPLEPLMTLHFRPTHTHTHERAHN